MVKYGKIKDHQDYDEIIEWITSGVSPRKISLRMRERYPNDREKQLGESMLFHFRSQEHPEHRERHGSGFRKTRGGPTETDIGEDISTRAMKLLGESPNPPVPQKEFTDDQIESWIDGLDGFKKWVKDIVIERGEKTELQDYQVDMGKLMMENRRVVFCTGAQVGKDFMMQTYGSWFGAFYKPNSTQIIMCAVQNQSLELMRRILTLFSTSVDMFNCIADTHRKPIPEIVFKNNSRMLFMTAQSLIAGLTNIDIVWVNEARDIKEEDVTRVSPLLGIGGGSLYVLSRPRFRRGYFWNCFNNPAWKNMQLPTTVNKYFDDKVWQDDFNTLSPELFKIEYLAQFADAGSSYFSETAVDKASASDYTWDTYNNAEPGYDYSLGVDWARLRDMSVMTVVGLHKTSGTNKLFHQFAFNPEGKGSTDFESQFAYMSLLNTKYNFRWVIPESSGMGIPLAERLVTEWPRHNIVKPYENRSFQAKLALYENTKNLLERTNTIIPKSDFKLTNQLKLTQFATTQTGQIKVETPITDDYSDSYCLAMWPFKKPFKMGIAVVTREVIDPYRSIRSRV